MACLKGLPRESRFSLKTTWRRGLDVLFCRTWARCSHRIDHQLLCIPKYYKPKAQMTPDIKHISALQDHTTYSTESVLIMPLCRLWHNFVNLCFPLLFSNFVHFPVSIPIKQMTRLKQKITFSSLYFIFLRILRI